MLFSFVFAVPGFPQIPSQTLPDPFSDPMPYRERERGSCGDRAGAARPAAVATVLHFCAESEGVCSWGNCGHNLANWKVDIVYIAE